MKRGLQGTRPAELDEERTSHLAGIIRQEHVGERGKPLEGDAGHGASDRGRGDFLRHVPFSVPWLPARDTDEPGPIRVGDEEQLPTRGRGEGPRPGVGSGPESVNDEQRRLGCDAPDRERIDGPGSIDCTSHGYEAVGSHPQIAEARKARNLFEYRQEVARLPVRSERDQHQRSRLVTDARVGDGLVVGLEPVSVEAHRGRVTNAAGLGGAGQVDRDTGAQSFGGGLDTELGHRSSLLHHDDRERVTRDAAEHLDLRGHTAFRLWNIRHFEASDPRVHGRLAEPLEFELDGQ